LGTLVTTILSPLTTATEPLFRKKLGERYFHFGSVIGGGSLWGFAIWFGSSNGSIFKGYSTIYGWKIGSFLRDFDGNLWLGIPLIVLFMLLGVTEIQETIKRQQAGELWHSRSRGESRFGSENAIRDGIIKVALGLVLLMFATMVGVMFIASWFLREKFSELERKRAYSRYLDAVDAQIEANFLFGAMLNATPPGENYGLHAPLPKGFTGKYRENIARAGSGMELPPLFDGQQPIREASPNLETPVIVHATPQNSGATAGEHLAAEPPTPAESQSTALQQSQSAKEAAPRTPIEILVRYLISKRPGIFGFAVLAVFFFLVVGGAVYHFTKAKGSSPAPVPGGAAKVVEPQKPKLAVVPVVPAPVVQVTVPEPPPIVATPSEPKPQVSAEDAANAAKAMAAAEKARQDEVLLGKIKSLIDGEADKIAKFKTDGETKLADNDAQIKAVSFFRRGNLTKANNIIKARFEGLLTSQEETIPIFLAQLPFIGKPKQMTHQEFITKLESILVAMEKDRMLVLSSIDEVTAGITKKAVRRALE